MHIFVDDEREENLNEIRSFTFEVGESDMIRHVFNKIAKMRGTGINPWKDHKAESIYAGEWGIHTLRPSNCGPEIFSQIAALQIGSTKM